MAKKPIQDLSADYIGLRILQGSGTAQLQFLASGSGMLRVTIPLHGLVRLEQESQRKGAAAKHQAYLASRKS